MVTSEQLDNRSFFRPLSLSTFYVLIVVICISVCNEKSKFEKELLIPEETFLFE